MKHLALKITSLILVNFALVCCAWSASTLQDQGVKTIASFIAKQAKRQRGEEYREARKVTTGDLTHDGVAETVVLYTVEGQSGSNNYVQFLAVFARGKGGLVAVTNTPVGGKTSRSVEQISVDNNAIRLETLSYGPKDPSCCPSIKGTTRYVLVGKMLRQQNRGAR